MSIFIALLLFFVILNFWVIWRTWHALALYPLALRLSLCILMGGLSIAFIATYRIPSNSFPVYLGLLLGSLWLAFFLYTLLQLIVVDLFRLLNHFFHWFPRLKQGNTPKLPAYVCLGIASISTLICLIGWVNATNPIVKEVELSAKARVKKPQTITIALLSDIHLGRVIDATRLDHMVGLIEPYKPDMVLFAGDVIDDHAGLDKNAMQKSISRLKPPLGIWGVPGNHEYIAGSIDESLNILEASEIRILKDSWATPGNKLLLVGRDDFSGQRITQKQRASLEEILTTVPEKKRKLPLIVMDHQPHYLEHAEQGGAVLQVSGHTHNGQLWPINYIIDAIYEHPHGHLQKENTHYLISVGAGTWGPPVRTNTRPEIVLIKLTLEPEK